MEEARGSRILVVDDEINIVEILKENLMREGYAVLTAHDGEAALCIHASEKPDLILLDCMLPGANGYDVCKKIRSYSDVPIIMLTARSEEIDKILGLELGADDYITKPFSVRELLARVKAHLRRYFNAENNENLPQQIIEHDELKINLATFEVFLNGHLVPLTLREYELLRFLVMHSGQVYTREALLHKVWGYQYYGDVRTVDVTIRRIREKMLAVEHDRRFHYIMTKRGVGYYFEKSGNNGIF